jgi:hypothetical protein
MSLRSIILIDSLFFFASGLITLHLLSWSFERISTSWCQDEKVGLNLENLAIIIYCLISLFRILFLSRIGKTLG